MPDAKIETFTSRLSALLEFAAEHGFRKVILDIHDWHEKVGVGLEGSDGERMAVVIRYRDEIDRRIWDEMLKKMKR